MMAVRTTRETMFEAEVHRMAGEIAILSPEVGRDEVGSIFRARTCSGAGAAVKILGTARSDEHGAALAR